LCTSDWAHEEQEEDPCVTKILTFPFEHNFAIPSSKRKLTIKFILEQLKQLGASIPAPSLSSASSTSLTLSPLIVIHLPCQKDALLSHFPKVAEALSPPTTFSLRQKQSCTPNTHSSFRKGYEGVMHSHGLGAA